MGNIRRMTTIDVSKLATIPFLDHKELHGRFLCSLLFYDGTWRGWIEAGDRVFETKMWPAEAVYFGTSPEQKTDVCLHFLDLIAQRLSYLPLGRQLFAMQEDVCNLRVAEKNPLAARSKERKARHKERCRTSRRNRGRISVWRMPQHLRSVGGGRCVPMGRHHAARQTGRRTYHCAPAAAH